MCTRDPFVKETHSIFWQKQPLYVLLIKVEEGTPLVRETPEFQRKNWPKGVFTTL